MKILLFGADGQVGWQLRRSLAVLGEVVALDRGSRAPCGDLNDAQGIAAAVSDLAPDVVVNAAAATDVDRLEDEPERAFAVNAAAPQALARAAARRGAWMVHYSSDYVYDGGGERPWRESDATAPLSVYGRSKCAGDEAVVREAPRHLVLRSSWIFDSWGDNFARRILAAAATRDELAVVDDQWGAPTRAALLADVTAHVLRTLAAAPDTDALAGVYHVAAAGCTTWHGYAQTLLRHARSCGWALRTGPEGVKPVPTTQRPQRARRPANSRLDTARLQHTFGLALPPWQDGVRAVVAELAQHPAARH